MPAFGREIHGEKEGKDKGRREDFDLRGGRRLNGFLGLSLHDRALLFLVILLDKTVSVG